MKIKNFNFVYNYSEYFVELEEIVRVKLLLVKVRRKQSCNEEL